MTSIIIILLLSPTTAGLTPVTHYPWSHPHHTLPLVSPTSHTAPGLTHVTHCPWSQPRHTLPLVSPPSHIGGCRCTAKSAPPGPLVHLFPPHTPPPPGGCRCTAKSAPPGPLVHLSPSLSTNMSLEGGAVAGNTMLTEPGRPRGVLTAEGPPMTVPSGHTCRKRGWGGGLRRCRGAPDDRSLGPHLRKGGGGAQKMKRGPL